MPQTDLDTLFTAIESKDDNLRYDALKKLLALTGEKVDWVYEKLPILGEKLHSDNSYQRSIALMLLMNLGKSDERNAIAELLPEILSHFEDEKMITSRQCLQNVWKLALANEENRQKIVLALKQSYLQNRHLEKYATLIKKDAIESLHKIAAEGPSEAARQAIRELIGSESDDKIKKALQKYSR